jgi:large subunit ribosomal protein L31
MFDGRATAFHHCCVIGHLTNKHRSIFNGFTNFRFGNPTPPAYLCPLKFFTSSVRQNPCGLKNHLVMKKGIHPSSYRLVVFKDMSNGHTFLSRSTAGSKETVKWEDGNEYPLIKLEISSTSHPFFTGKNVLVDTAGRIDKFKKKYEKKK